MGRSRFRVWIAVGDLALTFGAYTLAFLIRLGGFPSENWDPFLKVAPALLMATLVMLLLYNGYRDLHRPFLEVAGACFLTAVVTALVGGLTAYLILEARAFPRGILVLGGLLQATLLPLWRSPIVRAAKRRYYHRAAVFVTATGSAPGHLPAYIRVTRCCTPTMLLGETYHAGDQMVIVAGDVSVNDKARLVEWAARNQADLHLVPSLYEVLIANAHLSPLGDVPVQSMPQLGIPDEFLFIKRLLDILASLALLLALSPVLILVPLLIWIDSRGPIFFRQERVGERGRRFFVWKFRTMINDAEQSTGPVLAQKGDPRITRVGRFLRATRLDEIPQLLNVLRGEMSMVGPRPERPVFVAEFETRNPNFRLRELVKPGLTGLAQVMGRYGTTPENKLRYDLLYITSYSPWLDIRVMLWTVQVVLFPQSLVDRPPEWAQGLDWRLGDGQHGADDTGKLDATHLG